MENTTLFEPTNVKPEIDMAEEKLRAFLSQSVQTDFSGSELETVLDLRNRTEFVHILFAISRMFTNREIEYLSEEHPLKIRYIRPCN